MFEAGVAITIAIDLVLGTRPSLRQQQRGVVAREVDDLANPPPRASTPFSSSASFRVNRIRMSKLSKPVCATSVHQAIREIDDASGIYRMPANAITG